jgi:hypothetical protein
MVVLPLSRLPNDDDAERNTRTPDPIPNNETVNWVRIASATTLIAGGALLLTGRRRAGLVIAATGTSLALLDQKDVLRKWWMVLPGYISEIQRLLTQAEDAVDEFAAQREKLGRVLGR